MEGVILGLFAAGLLGSVLSGISVIYPLILGYFLFFLYGCLKKHSPEVLLKVSLQGIKTIKNILIVFVLIGMITAIWRAAGTIPMMIYASSGLMLPSIFLLAVFLLNSLVSFLTGTSFGTAATMGVICMGIGTVLGQKPAVLGGAILSGIFFGDRCSPMSTSALLVAELTETDIYRNVREMMKRARIPFLLSCLVYGVLGAASQGEAFSSEILKLFPEQFRLHWITLLPAVLILVLSVGKVNVKWTMTASILAGCWISVFFQKQSILSVAKMLVTGYHAENPALAGLLDGGGIVSMGKVAAIVCISSAYSGIFDETGLLEKMKGKIRMLSARWTPFGSALFVSVAAGMISCNQTLSIMLTDQLCREIQPDKRERAMTLEDTAVVVAPLIPWSIAGAVPLAAVAGPKTSILFACYLYFIPLWQLMRALLHRRNSGCGNS